MPTESELLNGVNQSTREAWTLAGSMEGGAQQGALAVVSASGERAVLKRSIRQVRPGRVEELARLIAEARERGWPTPAWRAFGTTSDAYGWWLYDKVDGVAPPRIDARVVEAVLPVVDVQAGMRPRTRQDWSWYTAAVVYSGESGFTHSVATFSPAGEELVRTVTEVTRPWRDVPLPNDDLVHGNLDPGNIIMSGDAVAGLVDVEAVGRGTRCVDIAGLIVSARFWGSPPAEARLIEAGRAIAGDGVLCICVAAAILALTAFGTTHWPGDVDQVVRAGADLLRDVASRS